MSDYNALVNLRFNRTSGPIDLNLNIWNSKSSTGDSTTDLVDYSSAGQFSGNCATFNGESSAITKMNGTFLQLTEDGTLKNLALDILFYLNSSKNLFYYNLNNLVIFEDFGQYTKFIIFFKVNKYKNCRFITHTF